MTRAILRRVRQRLQRASRWAETYLTAPVLEEKHILEALEELANPAPHLLLVHSSLSSCGRVRGGARTVIRALETWNKGGTIAMPTHSYCYPSATGISPVFDLQSTSSLVGAISDAFWKQRGVQRSLHPTHSLACEGSGAAELVAGHEDCDTPCGRGTPYERLIDQDAAVLMFGATMNSYTFFHTAEDVAEVPYLYEKDKVKLRMRAREGSEREMLMRKHDMTIARSFSEKARWIEERGLLRRVALGRGELLLLSHSRLVHDALTEQLREDPWFLTAPRAMAK